ncbi:uncharacterized protein LOC111575579 [Amphiprion ocellaris]|uniref:uncharacterized protein LOC111575579 n=1 Tax=Amphiprion ocellaris TaxID=80972 RepID=UPI00241128CF|nr:uncharacterized protein LOC111575579 [Amphiprion ocellaris]
MIKEKELDHLTGPVVNSFSTEELPDSIYDQQPATEQEKQLDHQTVEDSDSSIDISSLHLNQSKGGHKTFVEANAEEIPEEIKVQDSSNYCISPEKTSEEPWSRQQLDEQSQPEEIHTEEQDQELLEEDQVLEQQSTVPGVDGVLEDEIQESEGIVEEQAPSEEASSHETNPQPFPATMTAVPSTPTFSFSFSPASSPHQGTSDAKSPAFLFSLNSGPSTPGFPGFGFDVGSSQLEDSSFAFTGSLFGEKKTTESKSSNCPEFLFNQPEQSEDFQFAFASKSQSANKETSRDDFPFSFNF